MAPTFRLDRSRQPRYTVGMTHTTEIQTDEWGRPTAEAVAKLLSRVANSNRDEFAEIAALVTNDHRTLQQAIAGFAINLIVAFAENGDAGYVDGRNEFSVQVCQKLRDKLDDLALLDHKGRPYGMPVV